MLDDAEAFLIGTSAWPAQVEGLSAPLVEALFSDPQWLRVRYYRRDREDPRKAEAILQIANRKGRFKSYWFPVSHAVMERFLGIALYKSRGKALKYLREYIRNYRAYNGHWPNQGYVNRNSIRPSMTPTARVSKRPGARDEIPNPWDLD